MPGEDLVLNADMGRITLELKKVQTEMRRTEKSWNNITRGVNRGTKENQAALKRLEVLYGTNAVKVDAFKTRIEQLAKAQGSAAKSQKRMQAGLTQLSFATDDFLAVSSQQNFSLKGMASGFRAAINNVSTFLTTINPLAGIAATLGIGVLTGIISNIGNAAAKTTKETEGLVDKLKALRQENQAALIGSELAGELEKQTKAEELLAEAKKQDAAATTELTKANKRLEDAKSRLAATTGVAAGAAGLDLDIGGAFRDVASSKTALAEAKKAKQNATNLKARTGSEVAQQQSIITEATQQRAFLKRGAGAIGPTVSRVTERVLGGASKSEAVIEGIKQAGLGPGEDSARLREKLQDAAIVAERQRETENRKVLTPLEEAKRGAQGARRDARQFKLEAQSDGRETPSEKRHFSILDAAAKRLESAALALERIEGENRAQN